jgi:hypothetical protein
LTSAAKSVASARKLTTRAQILSFSAPYFRDITLLAWRPAERGGGMAGRTVVVRLNQQQLELIDRTIQRGEAADRVSLIRKALCEQAGKQRGAGTR